MARGVGRVTGLSAVAVPVPVPGCAILARARRRHDPTVALGVITVLSCVTVVTAARDSRGPEPERDSARRDNPLICPSAVEHPFKKNASPTLELECFASEGSRRQ
eukprot:scaffold5231_cov119-Isochrysis_galbana.AAC.2